MTDDKILGNGSLPYFYYNGGQLRYEVFDRTYMNEECHPTYYLRNVFVYRFVDQFMNKRKMNIFHNIQDIMPYEEYKKIMENYSRIGDSFIFAEECF